MNTVTVIPAVRVSEQVQPEFRVFSHEADALQIDVLRGGCILLGCTRKLTPGKTSVFRYSLKGAVGDVELRFRFYRGEKEVETSSAPYQVVPGSVPATGLIDGCWISICHWSEQEAVFFNSELKKMRDEDFERHIEEMSLLGIRGVVIQNVFDSSHYVGRHEMTCGSYDGRAFYPSGLYPGRMPLAARDPIEAVLRAADRCGMHVLLGVGLFAWFDFSEQSRCTGALSAVWRPCVLLWLVCFRRDHGRPVLFVHAALRRALEGACRVLSRVPYFCTGTCSHKTGGFCAQ